MVKCESCGKKYSSLGGLRYHIRNTDCAWSCECPTCGRGFLGQVGMKQHHSMKHGESIRGEPATCEECGKEFRAEASGGTRFCSRECWANYESKKHAENRPNVECEYCGTEFEVRPYRENTARFCSYECKGKYRMPSGKDNPNWKPTVYNQCQRCGEEYPVKPSLAPESTYCSKECQHGPRAELTCEQCGSVYTIKPSHKDNSRFCSLDCQGQWQSIHNTGENSPVWKGGYEPYYGPNWREMRRKALERDGHACQRCGKTREELGQDPDVHHIIPIRKFEDYKEANALSNLVSLCKSCHGLWEGIPLRPQGNA